MNSATAKQYRFWECEKCGLILGLTKRAEDHRTKLNVLKVGIPLDNVKELWIENGPKFLIMDLEMGVVVCQKCGARKEWRMSDHAVKDLFKQRGLEKV